MPTAWTKRCNHGSCLILTQSTYCTAHQKEKDERKSGWGSDNGRPSASKRGYDARWRKARKSYLSINPLCVKCEGEGRTTEARVVDHIIPHRGNKILFWDVSNWQSLCKACHGKKTMAESVG